MTSALRRGHICAAEDSADWGGEGCALAGAGDGGGGGLARYLLTTSKRYQQPVGILGAGCVLVALPVVDLAALATPDQMLQ